MYGNCPYTEIYMATATVPLPKAARKASQRIDVRLREEQKSRIERAAEIKGLSVTDFIIQNALEVASRTIREHETWDLKRPDAEAFFSALVNPPKPAARLIRSAKRYKEQYVQGE
jgi:uncharacterized protein (DUF1778 family)